MEWEGTARDGAKSGCFCRTEGTLVRFAALEMQGVRIHGVESTFLPAFTLRPLSAFRLLLPPLAGADDLLSRESIFASADTQPRVNPPLPLADRWPRDEKDERIGSECAEMDAHPTETLKERETA